MGARLGVRYGSTVWEHGTKSCGRRCRRFDGTQFESGQDVGARYMASWSNWLGRAPLKRAIRVRSPMMPRFLMPL